MSLQPIDGLRLKFRTEKRYGRMFATATIWFENEQRGEIATLDLTLIEHPGDESYQRWVDTISAAFSAWLSRSTALPGITTKRKKPSYKGE